MTTELKNLMPDPAVMQFRFEEGDGIYADYHWIQRIEGKRVEWQLTLDLFDNTWSARIDPEAQDIDASQAQVDALLGCMTAEQRADAEAEFREFQEQHASPEGGDKPSALSM